MQAKGGNGNPTSQFERGGGGKEVGYDPAIVAEALYGSPPQQKTTLASAREAELVALIFAALAGFLAGMVWSLAGR